MDDSENGKRKEILNIQQQQQLWIDRFTRKEKSNKKTIEKLAIYYKISSYITRTTQQWDDAMERMQYTGK